MHHAKKVALPFWYGAWIAPEICEELCEESEGNCIN